MTAEKAELENWLSQAKGKERRLRAINGWNNDGELHRAELALRDSAFPIYGGTKTQWWRIVAVDDNWVSLRYDRNNITTRYKIANGCRERIRTDYDRIDIQKALTIWAEHQAKGAAK